MKVLKFGAIWCPGCIIMESVWREVQDEHSWLEVIHHDVDENPDLIAQYNMSKFPVYIFLDKDGKEVKRLIGETSKKVLIEIINQLKNF